jgi:uncharacterized membrane protein
MLRIALARVRCGAFGEGQYGWGFYTVHDLDVNATADFDLTPLHQHKTDKTQFQKSFTDLSCADTILLCNPGATNLTITSGSVKKKHETPNLRLIFKTR